MIRSLGDELLGYKMQVSTDTEVHLKSYSESGSRCLRSQSMTQEVQLLSEKSYC